MSDRLKEGDLTPVSMFVWSIQNGYARAAVGFWIDSLNRVEQMLEFDGPQHLSNLTAVRIEWIEILSAMIRSLAAVATQCENNQSSNEAVGKGDTVHRVWSQVKKTIVSRCISGNDADTDWGRNPSDMAIDRANLWSLFFHSVLCDESGQKLAMLLKEQRDTYNNDCRREFAFWR